MIVDCGGAVKVVVEVDDDESGDRAANGVVECLVGGVGDGGGLGGK